LAFPERKLVDTGYATVEAAAGVSGLSTDDWSAVRSAREAGMARVLVEFANDLSQAWGDPDIKRIVCWPINMRIGRL